jgi:hypothetical protein
MRNRDDDGNAHGGGHAHGSPNDERVRNQGAPKEAPLEQARAGLPEAWRSALRIEKTLRSTYCAILAERLTVVKQNSRTFHNWPIDHPAEPL